ncbi:MAG: hypothetical protein K2N68_03680, partial [Clostridia bacterium]|nr:hypothetical protein [Clostridia bacterium]
MIKEKKTLLILRAVFGVLLLAGIVAAIVMYVSLGSKAELIDCDDDGYGYFVATFTEEVEAADIDFVFYDSNEMIIETKTVHFEGPGDVLRARIPSLSSRVVAYAPTTYSTYHDATVIYILILVDVILLALFIQTLTLSCKIYYHNGNEILVYAGFTRRYLKINGVKVEERSTAFTYGMINFYSTLSDGSSVWASITRMNRITLRVNNQVLTEVKNPSANPPVPANAPAPAPPGKAD